jgi:hypothetical protein
MQEAVDAIISQRSFQPFRSQDLQRLTDIAKDDLDRFCQRNPDYVELKKTLFAICLAQGGAMHFVDGKSGVKDLDVWLFFRISSTGQIYPPRVRHECDFGDPYFGRHPNDVGYLGRRVDILGRSIPMDQHQTIIDALRAYLKSGMSITPRKLAEKAIVIIWPHEHQGQIVWPSDATRPHGYRSTGSSHT